MSASELVEQGYSAIKQGKPSQAVTFLKQALEQDPENVKAYLGLARIAPTASESLAYVRRAENIAPNDPTVQKAKRWAENRMDSSATDSSKKVNNGAWQKMALGCGGVFLLLFLAVGSVVLFASFGGEQVKVEPIQLAELDVTSDGISVRDVQPDTAVSPSEAKNIATATPQLPQKNVALNDPRPTWTITPTPLPTATPTPTYAPTFVSDIYDKDKRPVGVGLYEQWIDVDVTTQTLTAYEGDTPVFQRAISSGTWEFPTVTGQFRIWLTYESQTMDGRLLGFDYYLEDVPYVMYFYGDYAIHGTYWHNNFGTPTSHGCVNMSRGDAGWLFNWADIGTMVNVHY